MSLLNVSFISETLGMSTHMNVVLPERSAGQAETNGIRRNGTVPVLYLFHGMADDHSTWQRYTSIERYASEKNIAVVMPATYWGWYTDMYRGYEYFTFIARELPEICGAMFPMLSKERKDTWAAGYAMGGYGAVKMGLRAGNVFSRAASLSGALDIEDMVRTADAGDRQYWENVFGPVEKINGSCNDLLKAAEEMKASPFRPDIYIWCGTEDRLYQQNIRMRDHLRRLEYNLQYEESPGGHQWKYLDEKIKAVLDWLVLGKDVE